MYGLASFGLISKNSKALSSNTVHAKGLYHSLFLIVFILSSIDLSNGFPNKDLNPRPLCPCSDLPLNIATGSLTSISAIS